MEITVSSPQRQLSEGLTVGCHFYPFVDKTTCVYVLSAHRLNQIVALAVITGYVNTEIRGEVFTHRHLIVHHIFRVEIGISGAVEVHLAERRIAVAFCERSFQQPAFGGMNNETSLRNPLGIKSITVRHAKSGIQNQHASEQILRKGKVRRILRNAFATDSLHLCSSTAVSVCMSTRHRNPAGVSVKVETECSGCIFPGIKILISEDTETVVQAMKMVGIIDIMIAVAVIYPYTTAGIAIIVVQ